MTTHYSEQLQEALLRLDQALRREQQLSAENEAVLSGLSAMVGATDRNDVLQVLQRTFQELTLCKACWILKRRGEQLVSERDEIALPVGERLAKVLDGVPLNAFDVRDLPEWRASSGSVRSALHLPLDMGSETGVLVLVSDEPAAFTHDSLNLARRILPFAEQAVSRLEMIELAHAHEKERMERQLLHAQKLESLGVLAGGIAHDFNNILAAIMGHAAMAENKATRDPLAVLQHLERIVSAAERAAELCKQMLAYSGCGKFVAQEIDLSGLIENITNMLEVSLNKGVVLKMELQRPLPVIEADAAQMQQIIMNLITNANEAIGQRSGVIAIRTGVIAARDDYLKHCICAEDIETGRFIWMEVSDTGCGMDQETITRMFDPFFTTKFSGRGLGMSAVLGIIRAHHGAMKVYSEPGHGTTIRVLFPALALDTRDTRDADNGDADVSVQEDSRAILVVDDEESIREMALMMLGDAGMANVLVATDGAEALEIYRRDPGNIALVILDLTMPHMDGEEVFRQMRLLNPEVRVILSSGYSESDVEDRFAGKGIAAFVQKPYLPETLIRAVKGVLREDT